ncbi:MAG TPA: Ig-like domain-containing protein [Flavobacteriales bacterium]|nr:Ig-like domain-containing protein [Flavobacteriales bacterium]
MAGRSLVWLLPVLITACAQVRDLSGGDKDTAGPRLIEADPAPLSTNFHGDRILLKFDERVKLERVRDRMLVSPPLEVPPTVHVSGARNVSIEFNAPLEENTTYTFGIGEAVRDLTEGNPAAGLTYVIATGDVLDSLMVTGLVVDAFKGTAEKDVLVLLYAEDDTASFRTGRPSYATRTDTAGAYSLQHLRSGTYRIQALRDQNANYRYDLPNEEIAFSDERTVVSAADTTARPITLRLFREPSSVQQVREARVIADGALRLIMARSAQEIALRDIARDGGTLTWSSEWNSTRDTVLLWPSDTTALDDGRYEVRTELGILDTLPYRPMERMPFFTGLGTAVREDQDGAIVMIRATRPLEEIDPDRFQLLKDSLPIPFTVERDSADQRLLRLRTGLEPGASASLTILPKAVRDRFDGHNDTLRVGIGRAAERSTGMLRVKLEAGDPGPFIVQLLDQQGRIVREQRISNTDAAIVWERLTPGNRTLRLIRDGNANGRWDTGSLRNGLQPEPVWRYPETVNVRAAWDLGVTWKLQ